jgi:hypothetical protein
MKISRLAVLSSVYEFKDYLHNRGFTTESSVGSGLPHIKVQFKDAVYGELSAPSVVIYPASMVESDLQIGGGFWLKTLMRFDIYAQSEGQMFDLVDYVREFIESPIYIRRYDLSIPSYQVLDGLVRPIYSGDDPSPVAQVYFEDRTTMFFDRVDIVGEATAHTAQVTAVLHVPTA